MYNSGMTKIYKTIKIKIIKTVKIVLLNFLHVFALSELFSKQIDKDVLKKMYDL